MLDRRERAHLTATLVTDRRERAHLTATLVTGQKGEGTPDYHTGHSTQQELNYLVGTWAKRNSARETVRV